MDTTANPILRPATERDSDAFFAMQQEAGLPLWEPNKSSWVVCADKASNKPLACVIFQVTPPESELLSIVTAQHNRKQGFALMLMLYSLKQLRKVHVMENFLEVRESNLPAISLYKRLGYEQIYARKSYYQNGETAIIFRINIAKVRK